MTIELPTELPTELHADAPGGQDDHPGEPRSGRPFRLIAPGSLTAVGYGDISAMGIFKKKPKDPSEIERIKSEIAVMAARLDAADTAKQQLGDQVSGLVTRLDTPPEPVVDAEAFESVSEQVQSISARLDQVDARITSISNELANQITELSSDIDGLSADGHESDLVERLRETQVQLANEQARYQIAFRQDLAHLADFLKHH